ncbi:MAG: alkaline phosphatase [Verrucomicrobia bacterium]|nr:alkaline phosphatase [Verrucomicrobiota bacterium]
MKYGRTLAGWMTAAMLGHSAGATQPANVIVMIGDGMGPEHVRAASFFAHGREGGLCMESLPHRAVVVTCPAYTVPSGTNPAAATPKVTDSAAAGTAIATGRKVYNSVLSVALPGDGKPIPTALENAAAAGKKTGLVTTAHLTDATPSAFGAHVKSRKMAKEIALDYLERSRPNLLLGGPDKDKKVSLTVKGGGAAGYKVVTDRNGLQALLADPPDHILGLFGEGGPMGYEFDHATTTRKEYDRIPHLPEMTKAALDILARSPKGFFLMVEGACIDKASHPNQLERAVYETVEFDKAVRVVVEWASKREDTLVLVTADHETGGLKVVEGKAAGTMPAVTWSTLKHTGAHVPLFGMGPGSEKIAGTLDNTDVFRLASGTFETPTHYVPPVGDAEGGSDAGTKGMD